MDYGERERLINHIASRSFYCLLGSKEYVLKHPTAHIRHKADVIYGRAVENCRFEEFLRVPLPYLVNEGLIVPNHEESVTSLTKAIKDLQIELYKSMINPVAQKDIRKRLSLVREKLNTTLNAKHMLDDVTIEGHANLCRLQYLIFKITYSRGRRLWLRKKDIDYKVMEKLIYLYSMSRIETSKVRELARTEPWHTIYQAGKPNPFGGRATDLTDNQKDLLYYTTMYENANQSMEPPSEDILNDDDLFDGWMHETIRRIKEDKKEKTVKHSVGRKYEKSQELFIPARTIEEAEEINKLNDITSVMLKRQRAAVVKSRGEVTEAQLPDKQMELQNMMRENAMKGRK